MSLQKQKTILNPRLRSSDYLSDLCQFIRDRRELLVFSERISHWSIFITELRYCFQPMIFFNNFIKFNLMFRIQFFYLLSEEPIRRLQNLRTKGLYIEKKWRNMTWYSLHECGDCLQNTNNSEEVPTISSYLGISLKSSHINLS